ncbi:MAG TPA: hypothetical protein PKI14_11125 [Fervidobacterium sp.]|nr:hypothetical protein [Fervidobacterium sp.]
MSELWDRQPGESAKAYAAFCAYRDLGAERSLEKVRHLLDKPRTKKWLGVWSAKYNWVERAKAYDDYIEKKKRAEKEKAIMEMVERHAKLAMAFEQRVAQRLQSVDPEELTPNDLARWLEIATRLERLSRGEPTEIGKQEVTLPAVVEVVLDDGDDSEDKAT